jgi:hypothetical protein
MIASSFLCVATHQKNRRYFNALFQVRLNRGDRDDRDPLIRRHTCQYMSGIFC